MRSQHPCLALIQQNLRFQRESPQALGLLLLGRALLRGGGQAAKPLARVSFAKKLLDPGRYVRHRTAIITLRTKAEVVESNSDAPKGITT